MKKKFAVIASGWHFPLKFYEQIAEQKIPEDWEVDYFCISHRDPSFAVEEKKNIISQLGDGRLSQLDKILYKEIATVEKLESLLSNEVINSKPISVGLKLPKLKKAGQPQEAPKLKLPKLKKVE